MNFNNEQLELINHKEGACVVFAGAGSGKSASSVNRVKTLIDSGVPQSEILITTFSNKSGQDLKKKISELNIKDVTVGTFHSVCGRILNKKGIDTSNKIKQYEIDTIFRRIDKKLKIKDIKAISGCIGFQKNNMIGVNDTYEMRDSELSEDYIRDFYKAYEDYKRKNKCYDWDDVLLLTYKELKKGNLFDTYEYVIVDECLVGDSYVKTDKGDKKIKTLYKMYKNGKELPQILSFNIEKEIYEYKPMTYAHKSENRKVYEVKTNGFNKIRCTDNHKILTQRGYIEVKDLIVGEDMVFLNNPNKQMTKLVLNEDQIQICLGSYLGDGYLQKRSDYNTYRLSFSQGIKQKDYFISKISAFNLKHYNINSGYTGEKSILYSNFTNTFILEKDPFEYMLDNINALGLAIWYQDDGSIQNKYTNIRIYTESFSYEQNKRIIDMLNKKFGICAKIKSDKKYYYLSFNKENTEKFLKIVSPYMHPSMQYKTNIDISNNVIKYDCNYKNYGADFITSIDYIGEEDVYDITVNDNHNFITSTSYGSTGIIVHNCQDLNIVQNELVKLLCPSRNIMMVGDTRQSIYGFRGSKPELMLNFKNEFPDTKIINLYYNYRSTKNIVECANGFIEPYCDKRYYVPSKAFNENNGEINIVTNYDKEEEAIKIANLIDDKLKNGVAPNDICVLYRNNQNSYELEIELKEKGISYFVNSDEGSFFDKNEIQGIMAILRLIKNPKDDMACDIILSKRFSPLNYLSNNVKNDIVDLSARKNISMFDACDLVRTEKQFQRDSLDKFRDNIESLIVQYNNGTNLMTIINNIIRLFKIEDYIEDKYDEVGIEERLASLDSLRSFVKSNTLDSFLNFVYNSNKSKKKCGVNDIQLMTCHKSKGLEFKEVFLIGVEDGKFPSFRAYDIREEARLFYVGITRAEENLTISQIGDSEFVSQYRNYLK